MAITAVTGFTESFSDTHPFYRGTYYRVVSRTATGSGNGTSGSAYYAPQQRLSQLTDFSFPYRFGGRFYLGVRATLTVTATASGQGTASSSASVLRQRQATGSGTGSEQANRLVVSLRTATGSGTGTSSTTQVRVKVRTATSTGSGAGTADQDIIHVRSATGTSTSSSAIVVTRVVLRTSSGQGIGGSSTSRLLVAIRTATGTGTGTDTSVGARINRRTGTGSGSGSGTADWVKSHIFRVPYTETYPAGYFGGGDAANRLRRYDRSNVRGLNLYKLTDGTYTTITQRDQGQVAKLWLGGRDHFLTDAEVVELTEAGFGASIT